MQKGQVEYRGYTYEFRIYDTTAAARLYAQKLVKKGAIVIRSHQDVMWRYPVSPKERSVNTG